MKRPERELWKEKPAKFNTAYPSPEELQWFLDQGLYEELDARLSDKTIKNKLKDIAQAELKTADYSRFPYEIVRKIYVDVDIRLILDESKKSATLQRLVYDDEFWRLKFLNDFPEVVALVGTKLPPENENLVDRIWTRAKFPENPWRSYYNVVRLFVSKARKQVVKWNSSKSMTNIRFNFYLEDIATVKMIVYQRETNQEVQEKRISFWEYLDFQGEDRDYLRRTYLTKHAPLDSRDETRAAVAFFRNETDGFNYSLFYQYYKNGYVKQDGNKVVIGNPICAQCNNLIEADPMPICSGCDVATYCSEECQEKHWTEGRHYKSCSK